MKRKNKKPAHRKKQTRKNPMTLNKDNFRRWIYLNLPKYKYSRRYGMDPEFESDLIKYFKIPPYDYNQLSLLVDPYVKLWMWLNSDFSSEERNKIWRGYLIEEPELFEAMYL